MKTTIKKNYFFHTSYQILNILVPFITTPYLSRVLGVSGIGLVSYANSVVSYFTLFATLGSATYAQRTIGYMQQKEEERSRVFIEILLFRFLTAAVTLLAYIAFLLTVKEYKTIYIILTVNLLNAVLDVTWFFQGMEEFQIIVLRNVFFKVINIAMIFLLIKSPADLSLYVFGTVVLSTGCNLSVWLCLKKYLIKVRMNTVHPLKHTKEILQLFLPTIAVQIYTVLDKSMIGILTGSTAENGYYEQADKVMKICLMLVASLGTVMIPRIANTYANQNMKLVKSYICRSYRFVWLTATPMFFGITAISDVFVPLFFGNGYEKVVILLPMVSSLLIIIGLSNVTGQQYFVPTMQQNKLTVSVTCGAVLNLFANALLIPRIGSVGAAVGSIFAECGVTAVQFIFLRKTGMFKTADVLGTAPRYFVSSIFMFAALMILKRKLSITAVTPGGLIMLITAGAFFYGVGLILLRDDLFISLLRQMRMAIKRIIGNGDHNEKE